MVDITTLTATCLALRTGPPEGELQERRKLRDRLRAELRHGTKAYIDTLARSKRGVLDEGLLASCRVAAEREMPRALSHWEDLNRLMATGSGVLAGLAAARQDLWRLAHVAIHLRQGVAAMRDGGGSFDDEAETKPAARLRRRIRRALVAYARVGQRSTEGMAWNIVAARAAALSEIGRVGAEEAERLGQLEASGSAPRPIIRMGVAKPLNDLVR